MSTPTNTTVTSALYLQDAALLVTASSAGTVLIYDSKSQELLTEFLAPKRKCLALSIFNHVNVVVAAYDDQCVRFFNLNDSSVVGYAQLAGNVTQIRALPNHLTLVCSTTNGVVYHIALVDKELNITVILDTQGFAIISTDISLFYPQDLWACSIVGGRVNVHERKKVSEVSILVPNSAEKE